MLNLVGALLLIAAPDPSAATPMISEKIEARVGKDIITSSDLLTMTQMLSHSAKSDKSLDLKQKALETLIERSLMRQYLERMGMSVSDREIEQKIASIRQQNGIATNEDFRRMLAFQGLTFDQFREQVRSQMENMQFVNVMRRQAQHTIDEKDMRAFYNANKADYKDNFEVELQECVILTGDNPDAALKQAEAFQKNPSTFDKCVTTLSKAPSAESGGRIGKFQSGLLREDIEHKVFGLTKNQVAIVTQPGAVQLIKVLERKDLGPRSFDAVKDKIRERLEGNIVQKEIQKTIAEMKATTFIQI